MEQGHPAIEPHPTSACDLINATFWRQELQNNGNSVPLVRLHNLDHRHLGNDGRTEPAVCPETICVVQTPLAKLHTLPPIARYPLGILGETKIRNGASASNAQAPFECAISLATPLPYHED